jgi:hypothetical protein
MSSGLRRLYERCAARAGEALEACKDRASFELDEAKSEIRYYLDPRQRRRLKSLLNDARTREGVEGAKALEDFKSAAGSTVRRKLGLHYHEQNALTAQRHAEAAQELLTEAVSAVKGVYKYDCLSQAYMELWFVRGALNEEAYATFMHKTGRRIVNEYEKTFGVTQSELGKSFLSPGIPQI